MNYLRYLGGKVGIFRVQASPVWYSIFFFIFFFSFYFLVSFSISWFVVAALDQHFHE